MWLYSPICLLSGNIFAEAPTAVGVPAGPGKSANARLIEDRRNARGQGGKNVIVFTGDNVIPHVVDGAGWKTTFVLTNLDTRTIRFSLAFVADNGDDLSLPVNDVGTVRGIDITLAPSASTTVETAGTAKNLSQGWAMILTPGINDRISGMAVFRAQVAGRADQEAVVPIMSLLNDRFILLFDNSNGYATSMALANPDTTAAPVDVTIRDVAGTVIKQDHLSVAAFQHQAFSTVSTWPETAGKKGSIEFRATGSSFGVSVLGLRFHPGGSFTSFHTLSNIDWLL
jgi:hypothetical protein